MDDMLKKIDTLWGTGRCRRAEKELVTLPPDRVIPENSNAPLQTQIEEIAKKQLALEETVTALSATVQKIKETVESGGTVVPEPEPPVTEDATAGTLHSTCEMADRL